MPLTKVWTDPTEIGATDSMSSTLFNQKLMQNMLYLKNPPFDQYLGTDADWSMASATPTQIDSGLLRREIDIVTGSVEMWGNLHFSHGNDLNTWYLGLEIDDDYHFGDVPAGIEDFYIFRRLVAVNNEDITVNFSCKLFGLSVGTHSVNPVVWTTGGTLTWLGSELNEMGMREI